jgi:hypothetical protein
MYPIETIAGAIIIDGPPLWAGSPLDWPSALGLWTSNLSTYLAALWHTAGVLWWPWTPLFALVVLVAAIAVRLVRAALWQRVAAGGYWVAVTPPRQVDPARWGLVWRRLEGLAWRARGGRWRLIRPPLAFEMYADGRNGLRAGLWVPGWVPLRTVRQEVAHAWPGAIVHADAPPTVDAHRAVAGVRLAADSVHPETGWLVDDPHPRTGTRRGVGTDPDLGMVFSALTDPGGEQVGLLLQVLVRPAPARRMGRLATAARHPVERGRGGVHAGLAGLVWLLQTAVRAVLAVLEVFLPSGTSRSSSTRTVSTRPDAPDPIQRDAMAEARAKHHDRPHLLATVRVFAAGTRRGQVRQVARSVVAGYGETSRWLRPIRLPRARSLSRLRRAGRREWLLLSANELGVLAHLPPDPALYRFDTAALHRPFPGGARRADPESGWTREGWADRRETGDGDGERGDDRQDPDADDGDDWGDDEYPEAV